MKEQPIYIVTFHSVYWAMEAERTLQAAGYACRLRPVPRQFSSSCGICVEVQASDIAELDQVLSESDIEIDKHYGPLNKGGR